MPLIWGGEGLTQCDSEWMNSDDWGRGSTGFPMRDDLRPSHDLQVLVSPWYNYGASIFKVGLKDDDVNLHIAHCTPQGWLDQQQIILPKG